MVRTRNAVKMAVRDPDFDHCACAMDIGNGTVIDCANVSEKFYDTFLKRLKPNIYFRKTHNPKNIRDYASFPNIFN